MRNRKSGIVYKACEKKRAKRLSLLQELCRINYKIDNKTLMKRLNISKTEFYRNFKKLADKYRKNNKCEALF